MHKQMWFIKYHTQWGNSEVAGLIANQTVAKLSFIGQICKMGKQKSIRGRQI